MAPYVRNLWYMAAWEREIEGDALLERTLLDEPWLIFRLDDGSGYAMLANPARIVSPR
jgi:vanillate O-demethylase monooxygenase subunit